MDSSELVQFFKELIRPLIGLLNTMSFQACFSFFSRHHLFVLMLTSEKLQGCKENHVHLLYNLPAFIGEI